MSSGVRRKASFKGSANSSSSNSKKAKNIDLGYRDDNDDDDEMIDSESDHDNNASSSDEDEADNETVDAKRVRLARAYLEKLEAGSDDSSDDGSDNRDRTSMRLQRQRLKRQGTLERAVADVVSRDVASMYPTASAALQLDSIDIKEASQQWSDAGHATYFRGHDLTVTCVALQASGEKAVSGSKDNSVILWDIETQTKLQYLCPQWKKNTDVDNEHRSNGEALSVACSDDGRYAVVGRRDATVQVFDIRQSSSVSLATSFKGHKGPVTSLAFRTHSNQLFSGSTDRCIRHYSLDNDDMVYMETLYGHQAAVSGIACHTKERPVSVGRDRTARAWKLADDAHLIFRGGSKVASADCVTMLKDEWFVTGHEDGNVSLWLTEKKKAVATVAFGHGFVSDCGGTADLTAPIVPTIGRGITAVGSLKGSDMVASGSHDGYLRLWRVLMGDTLKDRGIEPIGQIPVHGYINDVAIGPKARFCVVAVGQEPALGRWDRVAKAKNRFGIIQLRNKDDDKKDEEAEGTEEAETIRKENGGSDDEE